MKKYKITMQSGTEYLISPAVAESIEVLYELITMSKTFHIKNETIINTKLLESIEVINENR